jgi:hypothetical protein
MASARLAAPMAPASSVVRLAANVGSPSRAISSHSFLAHSAEKRAGGPNSNSAPARSLSRRLRRDDQLEYFTEQP